MARERRLLITTMACAACMCLWAVRPATPAFAVGEDHNCGGVYAASCGVASDQGAGDFHGVIAVDGSSWVLHTSATAGTKAGCADCTWTLVLDCATATPNDPDTATACTSAASPVCPLGQLLYRLYLTTDTTSDALEGTLCIGPDNPVVPVGDTARIDVEDYLKDVVPPDLVIASRPRTATLAGLPTYFSARAPTGLRPAPYGNGQIREAITISPLKIDWRWGDQTASGWLATPEGSATTTTHVYLHGQRATGRLTTRWGATYTITYAGVTVGPYDADGTLTKDQDFSIDVRISSPSLVTDG